MIKRWNGRNLIISPEDENTPSDAEPTALAKRLAQAHHCLEVLESGKYLTITLLTDARNLDPTKLTKILNLVNLSLPIQRMIVKGNAPESMTLPKLYDGIPVNFGRQKRKFSS